MKRALSIILSLSLVLCSCGKVNEPIVKRESANTAERKIQINFYDKSFNDTWTSSINVRMSEDSTVSVSDFEEIIPKDKCEKFEAFYWNNGTRKSLMGRTVNIATIDDITIICDSQKKEESEGNTTMRPTPESTPLP
ncbi:MAG: hypothetical protein LBM93_09535 [Oscillospiraceae bacterium]|jgi:hypothetical protein|nr:hypothetical protein [Oscillospiraceae bacterium]